MWKMKACPRCGGDVYIGRAIDTWYEQCLQCGYQRELNKISSISVSPERKKELALTRVNKHSRK